MNPVGLTRAEEAALQQPGEPRVAAVKAPAGARACHVTVPPDGKACGAVATKRIMWPSRDGWDQPTSACADCAARMQQTAELEHKTTLRVEPIEP